MTKPHEMDAGFGSPQRYHDDYSGISIGELTAAWRQKLKLLLIAPILVGLVTYGITLLIPPTYTATTTIMPPVQSQGGAAAALASLGALGSLAGTVTGSGSQTERYAALLSSANVRDSLIDRFKLMEVYKSTYRVDARRDLAANVNISVGKKDGLIALSVSDQSPVRAADIANQHVIELRRITSALALTEAQQRRVFFEGHLQEGQDKLLRAQQALQSSGFTPGALKAEPRAAAESYARLKAEVTAAEVRLQVISTTLADSAPEVQQARRNLAALQNKLADAERSVASPSNDSDYISKYRNYKYHETLYELYARQFELARVEESKDGMLFQVIDAATPPERRSSPKRVLTAATATIAAGLMLAVWVAVRSLGGTGPSKLTPKTGLQ